MPAGRNCWTFFFSHAGPLLPRLHRDEGSVESQRTESQQDGQYSIGNQSLVVVYTVRGVFLWSSGRPREGTWRWRVWGVRGKEKEHRIVGERLLILTVCARLIMIIVSSSLKAYLKFNRGSSLPKPHTCSTK